MKTPETNYQDTNGKENKDKSYGLGVSNEDTETLKNKLENINDLIDHDQPVTTTDLSNLESVLNTMKVDVGGIMMTPEEAKKIPDLKQNAKIWKEMSEGNFNHTHLLTSITPEVSKYLVNIRGDIYLTSLTSAEGLVLPQTVEGNLWLVSLTTSKGLVLPQIVKGGIYLGRLTTATDLILPKTVGGIIFLANLPPSEIEKLKEQRPDLAGKIKISV